FYRNRRAARVAQLPAATGGTLRPTGDVVAYDGRAQQIEADDVVAQIGAKIGGDCFRDFQGCERNRALSERVVSQGRSSDAAKPPPVEKPLDLAVAYHAIGETPPTGALGRGEYRPYQGKNAGRLDEQPRRPVRQMLPVQFGELFFEIIADQSDRQ